MAEKVIEYLESFGNTSACDGFLIGRYCILWGEFNRCENAKARQALACELRACERELQMTPLARTRTMTVGAANSEARKRQQEQHNDLSAFSLKVA
jgi:hypothetical protein